MAVWEMTWAVLSCLKRCTEQLEKCISLCCTAMILTCFYLTKRNDTFKKWNDKPNTLKIVLFTDISFSNRSTADAKFFFKRKSQSQKDFKPTSLQRYHKQIYSCVNEAEYILFGVSARHPSLLKGPVCSNWSKKVECILPFFVWGCTEQAKGPTLCKRVMSSGPGRKGWMANEPLQVFRAIFLRERITL